MSLQGLPDFHHPISGPGASLYSPYENKGDFIVLPEELKIVTKVDGTPDFQLELIRGKNPFLPPQPYGRLDFKVVPHYPLSDGLTLLRQSQPQASLTPASFTSGYLHINLPQGLNGQALEGLNQFHKLAWNGLGIARSTIRLSSTAVSLLKQALQEEILILHAQAEMEILGVAPRLPIKVRFNPKVLITTLWEQLGQSPVIARAELIRAIKDNIVPIQFIGTLETIQLDTLAKTLTDWLRVKFGQSTFKQPTSIQFPMPETVESGDYTWDLSTPLLCPRPFLFNLNTFQAARQLVATQGIEAVFKETVVPPIATGETIIDVSANLPRDRKGILAIGVNLYAPPQLPHRPQALSKSVELAAPLDKATTSLRFSPGEVPRYTVSTYIVTQTEEGITRLESDSWQHEGNRLALSVDQFPLQFIPIEASQRLLALASIRGTCHWQNNNEFGRQSFVLTPEQTAITLSLPKKTTHTTLEIEALDQESKQIIKLAPRPATQLQLGCYSFPTYGPHTVDIECVFNSEAKTLAIDVIPEGAIETPKEITTLFFTQEQSQRQWSWFATSPFESGFHYRQHTKPDTIPLPWSTPQSAFTRLVIPVNSVSNIET